MFLRLGNSMKVRAGRQILSPRRRDFEAAAEVPGAQGPSPGTPSSGVFVSDSYMVADWSAHERALPVTMTCYLTKSSFRGEKGRMRQSDSWR